MSSQHGFQRILVATDFSLPAEAALQQAVWLARVTDASIDLTHVLPTTRRAAHSHAADLVVIGTVGRSGIQGLLLGNTADKVLDSCDCSMLTVKPDNFRSPIAPVFLPSHPSPGSN